jgi:hypothetical protein
VLTYACILIDNPIDNENITSLPSEWNSSSSSVGFRYSHNQSAMKFLLKVSRLGSKIVIMAVGLGDDKTASTELVTKDWVSESFFAEDAENKRPVEEAYISPSRLSDLISLFKTSIVQKLIPGLHKPGYEEETVSTATGSSSAASREGGPSRSGEGAILPRPSRPERDEDDPLRIPRHPRPHPYGSPNPDDPPGFEDEYEINRPPGNPWVFPGAGGGRNPYRIGDDDLRPPGLGPNPPLRGPFIGEEEGNGMFVGPNHPMFGGRQGGVPDPRCVISPVFFSNTSLPSIWHSTGKADLYLAF